MNPSRMSALGGGGDGQWVSGGSETPWQGRARPDPARRDTRQRSLRTACTLMSVTSLTPACGPELLLTKYQRLSQLVRYTAFLEDATSALVREEVLDGDEKPTCSKCQKRQKCTRSLSIQKFPRILMVHLKRFSPQERFRGKLNTTVDFSVNGLDLSPYSAGQTPCRYSLY
ncbi:Ubiquitin carboxyl-terminal hydrolase 2 [Amphibalanus amphitrite]|uniref:ubiquitinyl hydrolase 1 n=1 Tax=Amphibalanus amphitrite TaxID=1232801 RepID=A0A6A4W7K2_AMPAM|nr:Ubiquitin carboxyl-terminal hydrolase 2 [Amphibalanus amphitrite]